MTKLFIREWLSENFHQLSRKMYRSHIAVICAFVGIFVGTVVQSAPFSNDPAEVPNFYELFNNPDAHLSLTNGPDTVCLTHLSLDYCIKYMLSADPFHRGTWLSS